MSKQEFNTLGRNIFEFRYDPIISFYDWKGTLAEHLIKEMGFDGFRVTQNRIDLVNPDEQDFLIFVSTHNAGLVFEDNTDKEAIRNKLDGFLSALDKFDKFKPKKIVRIGARWNLLLHKRNTSFKQIKDTFESYIVQLSKSPYKNFKEDLVDIGLPLNFKGAEYNYNIMHGPMEQGQALTQFFANKLVYFDNSGNVKSEIPKHGFFFDIDVFKIESEEIDIKKVIELSKQFINVGKEKFDSLSSDFFNQVK